MEWISVEDQMPELNQSVLVYDCENGCRDAVYKLPEEGTIAFNRGDKPSFSIVNWISYSAEYWNVSHWMPLPPPPPQPKDEQ